MNRGLNDIEKKNIYKVPEGYFDELPGIIQSRITKKEQKPIFSWSQPVFKLALPAILVLMIAGYFAFYNEGIDSKSASEILAEVETEHLIDYLALSEMTIDEILEGVDLNDMELEFGSPELDFLEEGELDDLEGLMDDFIDINEL